MRKAPRQGSVLVSSRPLGAWGAHAHHAADLGVLADLGLFGRSRAQDESCRRLPLASQDAAPVDSPRGIGRERLDGEEGLVGGHS